MLTICTKFGLVRDPDGPQGSTYDRGIDNSPAHMRRSCEESLARLGVDKIDLYYVHRIDPAVPIEETVGARGELVQAGKKHAIHLSEELSNVQSSANALHPLASLTHHY